MLGPTSQSLVLHLYAPLSLSIYLSVLVPPSTSRRVQGLFNQSKAGIKTTWTIFIHSQSWFVKDTSSPNHPYSRVSKYVIMLSHDEFVDLKMYFEIAYHLAAWQVQSSCILPSAIRQSNIITYQAKMRYTLFYVFQKDGKSFATNFIWQRQCKNERYKQLAQQGSHPPQRPRIERAARRRILEQRYRKPALLSSAITQPHCHADRMICPETPLQYIDRTSTTVTCIAEKYSLSLSVARRHT